MCRISIFVGYNNLNSDGKGHGRLSSGVPIRFYPIGDSSEAGQAPLYFNFFCSRSF